MNTIKLTIREKVNACLNIILGKPVMTNMHIHAGTFAKGEAFLYASENKGGVFFSNYIEGSPTKDNQ